MSVTTASATGASQTGRGDQRFGLAALLLAAAVPCGVVAYGNNTGPWPTQNIALGIVAIVLTSIACVLLCRAVLNLQGWVPLIARIGPAWVIYFTVTFGIGSVAWLRHQPLDVPSVAARSIVVALIVVVVALVSWTAGYLVPPMRAATRALRRLSSWSTQEAARRLRPASLPIWLYLGVTVARVIRLGAGRYGYLQDPTLALQSPSGFYAVLALFDGLALLAILLAALDSFSLSRSWQAKLTLAVLVFAEAGIGLFSASKQAVLVTLLAPALLYVITHRRIPRVAVGGFAVVAVVLFSFNASYRHAIRSSSNPSAIAPSTALAALPSALTDTVTQNPVHTLQDSFDSATVRTRSIDNVALVIDNTPSQIKYEPWSKLVIGPVSGLVPRVVWPSKPILSTGEEFTRLYYRSNTITASAITTPGDLYRHGGWLPVIIGMAFLGGLARLFDSAFDPERSVHHAVILIPLLLLLVKSESDFVSLLVSMVGTLALAVLVTRYGIVGRPKT